MFLRRLVLQCLLAEITNAPPLALFQAVLSREPWTIKEQCPVAVSSSAMQLTCYSGCETALIGPSVPSLPRDGSSPSELMQPIKN